MLVLNIKNDMKKAMKEKNKVELTYLRILLSALENAKVSKKVNVVEDLKEEEVIEVLSRQSKLLDQEKDGLIKAGRDISNVEQQKGILKRYLPEQLSESKLDKIINNKIEELGITSIKEQGKLMGILSKELKGRVEMGKVSKLVREKLN